MQDQIFIRANCIFEVEVDVVPLGVHDVVFRSPCIYMVDAILLSRDKKYCLVNYNYTNGGIDMANVYVMVLNGYVNGRLTI